MFSDLESPSSGIGCEVFGLRIQNWVCVLAISLNFLNYFGVISVLGESFLFCVLRTCWCVELCDTISSLKKYLCARGEKKGHLQYPEGTVDGAGKTCQEVFVKCTYLEDSGR